LFFNARRFLGAGRRSVEEVRCFCRSGARIVRQTHTHHGFDRAIGCGKAEKTQLSHTPSTALELHWLACFLSALRSGSDGHLATTCGLPFIRACSSPVHSLVSDRDYAYSVCNADSFAEQSVDLRIGSSKYIDERGCKVRRAGERKDKQPRCSDHIGFLRNYMTSPDVCV
jgi:hypothetical protein